MEDHPLDYQIDQNIFDYVVLGTNMEESIVSSQLCFHGNKTLCLDLSSVYCASQQTLSHRELLNTTSAPTSQKTSRLTCLLEQGTITSEHRRMYNVDLKPRLLFGDSATVSMMVKAQMDKYMDFKAVGDILYDLDGLITLPCTKGEIFAHKSIGLLQKRQVFQLMQTLTNVYSAVHKIQADVNSTLEFDKQQAVQEQEVLLYHEYKHRHINEYFLLKKIAKPIQQLFLYGIANYEFDVDRVELQSGVAYEYLKQQCTYQVFLQRLFKYVKSLQVYSNKPYLYPNYGSGDIPQAFSRIAAVHGATFFLEPKAKISSINKKDGLFYLSTNIHKDEIIAKGIVAGYGYREMLQKLGVLRMEQGEYLECLRANIIVKTTYDAELFRNTPAVFKLRPCISLIGNRHPVVVVLFSHSSQSTPKDELLLSFKTMVDSDQNDQERLQLIQNIQQYIQNNYDLTKLQVNHQQDQELQVLYKAVHVQKQIFYSKEGYSSKDGMVRIVHEDNFSLDYDHNFKEAEEMVKGILGVEQVEYKREQEEKEKEEESEYQQIIQKLECLKVNEHEQ